MVDSVNLGSIEHPRGIYPARVDDKGRIKLPADFHRYLTEIGATRVFVTSFDELTIALFVSAGAATTLPKQMWDDAILKVSPTLAAVSTLLLVFVTIVILAAEYFQRRAVKRA